jgi:hypothetical protein
MPETVAAQTFVFRGKTVDELRKELNDFAAQLARGLTTDTLTTKGIVFLPVEGPQRQVDAKLGMLFVRKEQFDDPATTPLHLVVMVGGKKYLILPTMWASATYNGVTGGLLD